MATRAISRLSSGRRKMAEPSSKRERLLAILNASDDWAWCEEGDGLVVAWLVADPPIESTVTADAIEKNEPKAILDACRHGRDVDHITRITGYFSWVSGWNKGKRAELKDRARVRA